MYIDDEKTLILDEEHDKEEFPACCSMYDENDEGYTRALVEVFIDRLEENILEVECEDEEILLSKEISKLKELDKNAVYMIVR